MGDKVRQPTAREVAMRFLEAYWAGDLERALAACAPGAMIELPPSVPLRSPAPISEVLPTIFASVYPRFIGRRFDIRIDRCIPDETAVVIEYTATGRLTNGRHFECRYLVVVEVEGDGVRLFRPYTDTKYVAAELLS